MNATVCGPALRPQAMSRDGVHSAWARCAAGMWAGSVAYPPFPWTRRCAATRRCLWKISTVWAVSLTSTSQRPSGWGTL